MNKEFIPYEQALELKELGFIDRCLGYYGKGPYGEYIRYGHHGLANNDMFISLDKKKQHTDLAAAPLYQQAFKWFREKHGYAGIPNPFGYELLDMDDINYEWVCFFEEVSNNYEEAELACLKKLIEIVKNK